MSGDRSKREIGRFRVLLVDDDVKVLESLEAVLSDDMDVVTVTSADLALRRIDADVFDVVCSDFHMPGMNGSELLRRVAQLHPHIGCLLVTGAEEYSRSHESNPHYVLLKPVDPQRLLSIVQQLARIAQMKRSVSTLTGATTPPASRRLGTNK